jgi:hypothetical protein
MEGEKHLHSPTALRQGKQYWTGCYVLPPVALDVLLKRILTSVGNRTSILLSSVHYTNWATQAWPMRIYAEATWIELSPILGIHVLFNIKMLYSLTQSVFVRSVLPRNKQGLSGWAQRSRYSNSLRVGRFGVRNPWRWDFPHPSRKPGGPTQPPLQWIPSPFPGGKAAGAWRWPPKSI